MQPVIFFSMSRSKSSLIAANEAMQRLKGLPNQTPKKYLNHKG